MQKPHDFPPMVLIDVEEQASPQFSDVSELTPLFSRPPDHVWAECFQIQCRESPAIDWQDAGFAKLAHDELAAVREALRDATHSADAMFIKHLETVDPIRASDIVASENISAVSVSADGPYPLPFGPPRGVY